MNESTEQQLAELKLENLHLRQQLELSNKDVDILDTGITEKKKIKKFDLIQDLIDNIPAFVALVDTNFNYVFVNNYYSHLKVFNPQNFIGKNISEVIGQERFEKQMPLYHKVLGGETVEYEIEHQSENNEHYTFEIKLLPFTKNNKVEGFFVYAFDITAIRTAKMQNKEKEEKYRIIFEQSHICTAIVGLDKKIIHSNDAFCRLLGYSELEMIGKSIADITFPEDRNIGMSEMKKIAEKRIETALVQKRYVHKNGKIIWGELTINIVWNEHQKPMYFIAVIQDITSRLTAENALKESEKNLRLITDNLPAIVGQIDTELKYIFANKAYEKYSEFKSQEIIGKNVIDVISKQTFKLCKPYFNKVFAGEPVSFENKFTNLAGEVFYLQSNYIPKTENNRVTSFYVLAWDITEKKKNELFIESQKQKLEETIAAKDKLFSIIAHDLRSPLGSIQHITQKLADKIESNSTEKIKNTLLLISDSTRKTLGLLENLLNWSKSQSGKIEFKPKQININDLVTKLLKVLEPSLNEKTIDLAIHIDQDLKAYADVFMLETIIRNLMSNAVKYSYKNGKINIAAEQKDKTTKFVITDNGVGIDKKHISNLFSVENSFSTIGTNQEEGSGLGLILCKEFVDKHGGDIWVESEPGNGSNFIFTIPMSE